VGARACQELQEGLLPYLFGGVPEDCQHCSSDDYMPRFCRFGLDGHGQCWGGRREALVQTYLARGFTDILTFTPCDLLPLLRGRTLFFAGDSQTQVRAAVRWVALRPLASLLLYLYRPSCGYSTMFTFFQHG
jgi:hypothetical protein